MSLQRIGWSFRNAPPPRVAVNISGRHLQQGDLAAMAVEQHQPLEPGRGRTTGALLDPTQ